MATILNERIELNSRRISLGKTMGAWCLCPVWMSWMPWLQDGDEVRRAPEKRPRKRKDKNVTSHQHPAGLKGI